MVRSGPKFKKMEQLRTALQAIYPTIFSTKSPLPLSMGIHKEIMNEFPGAPRKVVNGMLLLWTRRRAYNQAIATSESLRYHLDGSVSSPVSEGHREFAKEALKFKKPEVVVVSSEEVVKTEVKV